MALHRKLHAVERLPGGSFMVMVDDDYESFFFQDHPDSVFAKKEVARNYTFREDQTVCFGTASSRLRA